MNLIVLIQMKEELYNLCLDAVQAPPRVLLATYTNRFHIS